MYKYALDLNVNVQALFFILFSILLLCLTKRANFLYIDLAIIASVFFIIILIFKSRSALIAFAITNVFIYKKLINRKRLLVISLLFIGGLINISYNSLKNNSIIGRYYILKRNIEFICSNKIYNNDSYNAKLNHFQIEQFKNKKSTNNSSFYADSNFYALNEWLQFTIEKGILGLVCLVICFIYFFNVIKKKHQDLISIELNIALLIPFYVYLFISYPLHNNILLSIFILLNILLLFNIDIKKSNIKLVKKLGMFMVVSSVILFAITTTLTIQNNNREKNIIALASMGYNIKANNEAVILNKSNPNSYQSNLLLAQTFLNLNKIEQGISVLEKNHYIICSYESHLLLANSYYLNNNLMKAKSNYYLCYYLLPNRVEPSYLLMNLYKKEENKDSALFFAQKIINTTPKIINSKYKAILKEAVLYASQKSN